MKRYFIFCVILILLLITGCGSANANGNPNPKMQFVESSNEDGTHITILHDKETGHDYMVTTNNDEGTIAVTLLQDK